MRDPRYVGTHRAPAQRPGRFAVSRRDALWAAVCAFAMVMAGAVGAAAAPGDTIGCAPGQELVVMAGGTWECRMPPAPTTSPSPSVSPSASPSVSPSPSPTTPPPSPSPTPSPTSTGLLRNCFGDVKNSSGPVDQARLAACGYPTLASTGVPAGTVLTAYTGSLTITTAGTVIDGKTIPNCLDVRATGVTIRNSRITCTSGLAGVYGDGAPAAANLRIERVEINCVTGQRHGVWVHGATIVGAYIHDCENAGEINANTVVRDSYLASRETGAGHADDLQSQGGSDVQILHNTFAGLNPITSSIITNPDGNSRWTLDGNFFSAGAFTLYCPENVGGGWIVRNNRFYAPVGSWQSDPHRPAYGFTDACGGVGTWLNNYKDNDLTAVNR